ncbi:hypothetical protein [Winogradskya humida]|uniref:Uncharacterized protein n=1 Tax=Winogradskya humida TaxID=113566 RepID=A0ABQ4A1Y1_9ACTN|nr:hypothetical protein [Actinoplanes humidus]GIE24865.1 hypothetical protein Ahu01nite_079670 [Actinoplanes humidus]
MAPSYLAGYGRLRNGEWGAAVENVVVYSSREGLRTWAQSIVDRLPGDRTGKPLVIVNQDQQQAWLTGSHVLGADPEERAEWTATVETVCDLMQVVAKNPAAFGWTFGDGVTELFAHVDDGGGDDDAGGMVAAVKVDGFWIGCEPVHDDDLVRTGRGGSGIDLAHAVLMVIADRIDRAY